MIKFYFKILNKMFVKNLLKIVAFIILLFNIILRVSPKLFINIPSRGGLMHPPIQLFVYCDEYLLLIFIILMFFFLGTDFSNSMEDIGKIAGGRKTNKFMLRKLGTLLIGYLFLYSITFINIYTIYIYKGNGSTLIPLKEIIFYSFTTNFFIIALSLFLLFVSRDIVVSTCIITFYYLIEESLWRCKIMQTKGILGHIYQYFDYGQGEIYKLKVIYIILSLVLLYVTYLISKRKLRI